MGDVKSVACLQDRPTTRNANDPVRVSYRNEIALPVLDDVPSPTPREGETDEPQISP